VIPQIQAEINGVMNKYLKGSMKDQNSPARSRVCCMPRKDFGFVHP
jgi:hypothetical protein